MTSHATDLPLLIERVERALIILAYLIDRDGDVYVPLYEKLERDLAELSHRASAKDRAPPAAAEL